MITPNPGTLATAPATADEGPPPEMPLPPTPLRSRLLIAAGIALVGLSAYLLHDTLGYRVQAGAGIICFLGLAAMFSKSLQSVSRKTLLWGIGLQFALAVAVIHSPQVQVVFEAVGAGIKALITASDKGEVRVWRSCRPDATPVKRGPSVGGGLMTAGELERSRRSHSSSRSRHCRRSSSCRRSSACSTTSASCSSSSS